MRVALSIKDLKKWIKLVGRRGFLLLEFSKNGVVVKGETENGSKVRSFMETKIDMMDSEVFLGLDTDQLKNLDEFMRILPKKDIKDDTIVLSKDVIDFSFTSKSGESYIITNDYSVCEKVGEIKKIEGKILSIDRKILDLLKPFIDIIEESEINSAEYIKISNLSNKILLEACSGINYGSISVTNIPQLNALLFRESDILFLHYSRFKDLYQVRSSFNLKEFRIGLSKDSAMLVFFDKSNAIYLPLDIPEINLDYKSILSNIKSQTKFKVSKEQLEFVSKKIEGFNRKDTKAIMSSENNEIFLSKFEKDVVEDKVLFTKGDIKSEHLIRTKTIASLLDIINKVGIYEFNADMCIKNSLVHFYGKRSVDNELNTNDIEVSYIIKGLYLDN